MQTSGRRPALLLVADPKGEIRFVSVPIGE
jgi:hypothetical protein